MNYAANKWMRRSQKFGSSVEGLWEFFKNIIIQFYLTEWVFHMDSTQPIVVPSHKEASPD